MLRSRFVLLGLALGVLFAAGDAGATPLIAMQAASQCDSCHVMPDRSDPKWVEENTPLIDRKCRATCGACHVNPTGGMLRTPAGNYYGDRVLTLKTGVGPSLEKGLHLVRDNEVDITDNPIVEITRQYGETLDLMRELNLEVVWFSGWFYLFYGQWRDWGVEGFLSLEWVAFFHVLGAYMILVFVIAHVYLITAGGTPTSHLKAMITGWEETH